MSQSFTPIGRVTADLELKTSVNQNSYVRFDLAESIRVGGTTRTQYLQVWAWGEDARRLVKSKVRKGSLIWVTGTLILEEYKKQDGATTDKRLKVILDNWGYIPAGKPQNGETGDDTASSDEAAQNNPFYMFPDGEIDGDRESLPE
ncbi:MAG: single-stranded DNA-binding protein [Oscillospiraceae bacterium]|nr:single-stranded DNA-binding protein [Oscillospiraceae bacterium]